MKLIIGLGNPGEKYKENRHNAGHVLIDKLKTQNSKLKSIMVFKTDTFMNTSGEFVKKLVDQYKIKGSDLWIIHDDLDIPLGSYKIQFGVGPKVHNGLLSIYKKLGTKDFWHVRIGIDNRTMNHGQRTKGEDYVLQDFDKDEKIALDKVVREVCKKLVTS